MHQCARNSVGCGVDSNSASPLLVAFGREGLGIIGPWTIFKRLLDDQLLIITFSADFILIIFNTPVFRPKVRETRLMPISRWSFICSRRPWTLQMRTVVWMGRHMTNPRGEKFARLIGKRKKIDHIQACRATKLCSYRIDLRDPLLAPTLWGRTKIVVSRTFFFFHCTRVTETKKGKIHPKKGI